MENTDNVKKELLDKFPFIKEQIQIQRKLSKKFGNQEYRKNLHESSANTFAKLLVLLEETVGHISLLEEKNKALQKKGPSGQKNGVNLNLTYEEVSDLPEEVLKELSFSDTDKAEYQVCELIRELGGIASLDRLIVGIYRDTNEVVKRPAMTSRLYRMMQKGLVYSVPGRKGVYSLEELTLEDADKLIKGVSPPEKNDQKEESRQVI